MPIQQRRSRRSMQRRVTRQRSNRGGIGGKGEPTTTEGSGSGLAFLSMDFFFPELWQDESGIQNLTSLRLVIFFI